MSLLGGARQSLKIVDVPIPLPAAHAWTTNISLAGAMEPR
jgi:hypothetical protein